MILDAQLSFSYISSTQTTDNVSAINFGNTGSSNNIIDLHGTGLLPTLVNGQGARDLGIGDSPSLELTSQVVTTFTSAGAATLIVLLQGATDNGSGAPAAWSTWWSSPTYALATLVQGAQLYSIPFPRPPAGIAIPRFIRMAYTVGVANFTAGALGSYIVLDRFDQPYQSTGNAVLGGYPAGITIAN